MHYMENSAKKIATGRSQRMARTRLAITRTSRDLTAAHGFNGFTIEQLCEEVGISRRTFFNYFSTKLDAVFGHGNEEPLPEGAIERFQAARPAGLTGISPTLLADLVALVREQLEFDEQAILSTHGFFQAVHREPELLDRMIEAGHAKQAEILDFVAQREGVDPRHPALMLAVHTVHFSMVNAIERFQANAGQRTLSEEFMDFIEAGHGILNQPLTR